MKFPYFYYRMKILVLLFIVVFEWIILFFTISSCARGYSMQQYCHQSPIFNLSPIFHLFIIFCSKWNKWIYLSPILSFARGYIMQWHQWFTSVLFKKRSYFSKKDSLKFIELFNEKWKIKWKSFYYFLFVCITVYIYE